MKIKNAEQLVEMLKRSDDFMSKITNGFHEKHERIFYRRTDGDKPPRYPNVLDNTLSSYLEKIPKNIIQKLPDFKVSSNSTERAEDLVYEFIAKEILLKQGSRGYSFMQKQWIAFRNANVFGMNAVYTPFIFADGEYSVGFENIYWGDLFLEPYCSNVNSANWVMFRTLLTEDSLQEIIDNEDEDISDGWDREALKELIKDSEKDTPDYKGTNLKSELYGLSNDMFQLFVYTSRDEIITFNEKQRKILRRIPNPSGRNRVIGLYYDYDGISPFGRSLVDLAYDQQRVLDFLLQSYLYNTQYNLDPTLVVNGVAIDEDNFTLESGNVIFTGDEQGEVKPVELNTTAITNFPNIYSLVKSTLTASLPSSNETGFSAEIGNPNYSRTQAGVNSQNRKIDIENNYSRKNYESFFERYLETAINVYISEIKAAAAKQGFAPKITLNNHYANEIRNINTDFINDDNEVRLDLSDIKEVNISVEFESTRAMAKEEDLQRLNDFIKTLGEVGKSNPAMGNAIGEIMPLLAKEIMKNSNLENSADIAEKLQEAVQQEKQKELQMTGVPQNGL